MAQSNDDIKWLYGKLKAKGYDIGTEQEFTSSLSNQADRDWYYQKATAMGLNMGSKDDFESMYAPAKPQATAQFQTATKQTEAPQQAETPQSTSTATPAQSEQPVRQLTEQEKIRMSYEIGQMMQGVRQGTQETLGRIDRIVERNTQKGRDKLRAAKLQARLMGTPTKVMGLMSPDSPIPADSSQQATDGNAPTKSIMSGQSPQPYGVVFENGKKKTQWLLPDGRLTTSLVEADQAEYQARKARLANEFTRRMKENGLDPDKPEDVQLQAEYDLRDPIMKTVAQLWSEAEEKHKADRNENADREWSKYAAMGGGREMRTVTASMNRFADNVSHMTRFDIEKMMDNAWSRLGEEGREQLTNNCYNVLANQNPGASSTELQTAAQQMARQLTNKSVYDYAVAKNTPKSTLEYFGRTVADMNLLNSISKGLARSHAGTSGDLPAYEAAMGEYGKNHRVAQVAGTVTGMALDPVTWISGGVGSIAGKGVVSLGGRVLASRAATSMSAQVGSRLFGSSLTGRIITGAAGGAGNFATYETLKEGESQFLHGGHVNPETGENEGYSAGDMLKAGAHGLVIGSVTGTLSPVIGNVADKAVKTAGSTAGKVAVRGGEVAVSTLAEGTVFSIPEWISGDRDAFDVWTDNMAMMVGFKASHGIKSAPHIIESLRPIKPSDGRPLTQTERNHNRMSFVERLRKRMDASPRDLAFSKEEREELRRAGYGELAELFSRDKEVAAQPADGAIEVRVEQAEVERVQNPEFDGYSSMEHLMQDGRVSEAARAKAYYILTGRKLPMSSVVGWNTTTNEDGSVVVESMNAQGGVVTSRRFANESEAKAEEGSIQRQAELNTVDIGERFREQEAIEKVVNAAIKEVAPEADPAMVAEIYGKVKRGDKDVTDAERQLAVRLQEAIERNKETGNANRPETIRTEIKETTGVDVDAALRKQPGKRTEAEQNAVQTYMERLYPEETRKQAEPTPEQQEAQQVYEESKQLFARFEEGTPEERADAQADMDAIALRMQEAYQVCEDVFGAEAEMRMSEMQENPWELLNNNELTADQQDAVLYYINAKYAMDGVQDAANESADRKREAVTKAVADRTHRDTGVVQPAKMKVKDRPVYIIKGDVVMFEDGSAVDVRNSSESVIIMDAQTGELEFSSPDQIFQTGTPIDPQVELDNALAEIDAQRNMFGATEEATSAENNPIETKEPAEPMATEVTEQTTEDVTENQQGEVAGQPHRTETQVSQPAEQVTEQPQTALSRIPVNEQGEPMFESVDRNTAWDGLVEAVGGDNDAIEIAMAQIQQASADLDALKKKQPTPKAPKLKGSPMAMAQAKREANEAYQQVMAEYNQQIADTQARLDAWHGITAVYNSRNAELRRKQEEERRQLDEKVHAEAVARLEEDKRIKAEKQAEQEKIGTHAVNPKIKERWDMAQKVDGHSDIITLPDGSSIRGRYVLTEAGAASASHDANNAYSPTEGFPIDENGQSVNDRDYQRDQDAQRIVEQMAGAYDNRALQTPVIVSNDGVVLSGNNRTMSGDIAAQRGTDAAYVAYLQEFGSKYGFNPEQVQSMKNPRVVFVPDETLPYDATTFSRFNAQEMKSQSKPETAVKLGKIVPDNVFSSIVSDISRYDRLGDYYADEKAVNHALGVLMQAGVINDKQMPEMKTGTALSAAGKELIENTLIGKVFQISPDAVREIISMPTLRQSVVMGLNEIASNRTLAKQGYDLSEELSKAVDLVYRARTTMPDVYTDGMPVSPFGRARGLFDDEFGDSRVTDGTTLLLADLLNSGKPSEIRKVLSSYNNDANNSANGQLDMFSGSIPTKEEILTNVNNYFRNATPKEQQALVDAAIAERKRRAEAEAEQRGRDQATEQVENPVQRSAEPQQPVPTTESELTPEEKALAARVEVTENDWEEQGDNGYPVYKREIILDGKHKVLQVDAPTADGNYTGSYFEFDGQKFGFIGDVATHVDAISAEPTEAQKKAGNYKMEHRRIDGMEISIENAKGSVRKGKDADGTEWETEMHNDYGYIRGTVGKDKDHIDIFLSDTPEEGDVFVVNQVNKDGSFDEHKVMYGFNSEEEARKAYLSNYDAGWTGLGGITRVSKDDFKAWAMDGKRKMKPFAEYKAVKIGNNANRLFDYFSGSLQELINKAKESATDLVKKIISPVSDRLRTDLSAKGIDIDESYKHVIDNNAIRHALKHHGGKKEENRGQIPITDEDFNRLEDVVSNYDFVEVEQGKRNNENIIYSKTYEDGTTIFVEEKRDGRKELAAVTMWKKKSSTLTDANSRKATQISDLNETSINKGNDNSGNTQEKRVKSVEPYIISPATYINKKGKETPMHRITFNRELTKEEQSAINSFAREKLGDGRFAPARGWKDKDNGGWLFRSDDDAQKAGAMLDDTEAVANAQPLSREELNEAIVPEKSQTDAKQKQSPINRVSVEDVFSALNTKGETRLSDHATPIEQPKQRKVVITDEMKADEDILRDILGIDDDEIDNGIRFRDPDKLTPEQRKKVYAVGVNYSLGYFDQGIVSFLDFATEMVGRLGQKIKPWLKSFYEGAKRIPGYDEALFTPTDEVDRFDVANFDRPNTDVIAQAEMIVEEAKVQKVSDAAEKELTETRNKKRKEHDEQTATDTAALTNEGETVASKVESVAETSADAEELNRAAEQVDKTLDKVNDQLALLGWYEAEKVDKDYNEAYGYMRNAEKKAVADAIRLAKQLVDDLGLDIDKVTGATTSNRNKKRTAVSANIAPAGGDIAIRLPLAEGRELYVDVSLVPNEWMGGRSAHDDLIVDGIMYRVEKPDGSGFERYGSNCYAEPNISYSELLKGVEREAYKYLHTRNASEGEYKSGEVVQYSADGGSNWVDAKVVQAEDGMIRLDTGLAPVMYVNAHPEQVRRMQTAPTADERLKEFAEMAERGESPYVVTPEVEKQLSEIRNDVKEDIFEEAARIASEAKERRERKKTAPATAQHPTSDKQKKGKKKTINHEQTVGDLFGGLFDNTVTDNEKKTDVQPRPGTAERDGGHEPQPNEPLGKSQRNETERPDGRGMGGRGSDNPVSDTERSGSIPRLHESAERLDRLPDTERKNLRNNHADRGVNYAPKGDDARIAANIEAIRLSKELLANGEEATPEQMAVLRKFSGWGGLGKAFNEELPTSKELRTLLGEQGYQDAVDSRRSAYYTPANVIDAMWDIAKAVGFKGGNVLEGSAGIGNILGLMPQELSDRSDIHAVEIDSTTGGILSLLYPDAKVEIQGFQNVKVRNGSIDLAITNVPFIAGLDVFDKTGDKDLSSKFKIADFCIAKNIRKLREGGIGIFITSSGTMDDSARLRAWITKDGNADVIGAFRMHNKTFGGTGATSDIIVVRKRVNGKVSPNAIDVTDVTGIRVAEYDTGDTRKVKGKEVPVIKRMGMEYNKYFAEHPENMAGEMMFNFERGETRFPTSRALFPSKDKPQEQMLAEWANRFSSMKDENETSTNVEDEVSRINEQLGEDVKEGSMVLNSQGQLCFARMGEAVPIMSPQADKGKPQRTDAERISLFQDKKVKGHTKAECFKSYTAIKRALQDVLEYQSSHEDNAGLEPLLKELNRAFDAFTRTYGNLHKNTAIAFLRNDVDFSSILALETYSEKGDKNGNKVVKVGKTDIFSRRVIETEKEPQPTTVKDGILASLYKSGIVDVDYIAQALGKSAEEIKQEIVESGLGFENPATNATEVSYQYLSGNVREKLHIARENNEDGRYNANISALEKALPMTIPAHLIEFSFGSSWIEPKLYEDFIEERTGIKVKLTNAGGTWAMQTSWNTFIEKNRSMSIVSKLCDKTIMGHELMEAALTNRTITVSKTTKHYDGTTETITDREATTACANKVDEIRSDFKDWARSRMQERSEMSERIEQTYNDKFNNYVPLSIPEEFVPKHFGGQVSELHGKPFSLRPHQGKAVVRATTQPVLLAHEVGTGKTYTLITSAMEMRRLGTARKPMIVVQNATVGQFVESAKEIYPNAKVLTIEEADRTADGRRNFYAKIKYNDWDMIVVPQSVFERIPDSEERQMAYIKDIIEEKMKVLEAMREQDDSGRNPVVRQAEKELADREEELARITEALEAKRSKRDEKREATTRQNAEVKALKMLDREVDDVENFDDMGIDAILVDEAHEYKHLGFSTAMQRGVKGIDPSYSKKSQGVFLKVQAVLERNHGRNVVFATGTPISNTAAEIWTFMRYLMPADTMKEYGIYYFDDFVRNFGNISQMVEFKTSGKFDEVNRFAGYVNLPELVRIWSSVADTVLTRDAGGVSDKIPDIEGGKAQDIFLPQTRALRSVMKYVKSELQRFEEMTGKEKKANSHIPLTMYGVAKAAAVDARLVIANAEDDQNTKTNAAVRETLRSLNDSKKYKGTIAIFADNYQNKRSGFNLYEDIRNKLIEAGVPEEQIVIIKSGMTVKKKLDIFEKVNAGEIRVVMGSTFTLGTGVNIQERLHTAIHVDAPNRPMDYTQRNGRILRQGNLHKDMGIPVRVLRFGVEDSLDVTAYQRLKTKGAIADSIMNGSKMMQNSMENRVLEEEEDVFGDMTAQLSGSQYAVLKNQAEREVRSLTSKQKQHDMDQIYLHNSIPKEKGFIAGAERRISIESANLETIGKHFPNGKIGKITIGKLTFDGIESMGDFFKEQNSKMEDMVEQVENGAEEANSTLSVNVNGLDFVVMTHIGRKVLSNGQGTLGFDTERSVTFSCDALGLKDVSVKGNRLKGVMTEISENIATGANSRKLLSDAQYSLKTHSEQLSQMEARYGNEFKFGKELEEAKARFELYESKMREEMAEKEKKYAELDKEVETATDVELTDEEEQSDAPDEKSTTKFREIEDSDNFYDEIGGVIEARVAELSQKLHTPIRVISDPEEIAALPTRRHQRAKGWVTGDGEIVVVVPNNDNVADIENTVVHEVIGHDGLRAFIGEEHFEEFLGEVYDHAGAGIKKTIDKRTQAMVDNEADRLTRQKGGGVFAMAEARVEAERKREQYRKEATEEYMADMAGKIGDKGFEKMNQEEMSLWGKIKAKVMQFLDKFLRGLKIVKSMRLTDKDLAYILFKSWRRKRGMDGVFAKAEDVIMRRKLHYNESKAEAEYALETANRRFNGQLAKYAEGKLSTNALIHLGEPMGVMREFLPSKPIVMRPRILRKASETKHNIDLAQLKDLPKQIAEPIFVFQRSDNAIGVLTEIKDRTDKNVCVAIELNKNIQDGAEYFEVNDIRSIHGRDVANVVLPIVYNNTLRYADKKKGLEWLSSASSNYQQEIAKQDLDMATKVVENFENPSEDTENVRFRDGDDLVSRSPVIARAIYENRVASSSYQVREALQDSMLGLMEAYRAIDKASGRKRRIEDVPEAENAYLDENRMSSVNQAEQEAYERLAIKPMLDEVARLAKDEAGYDDLLTYMMAKHGLERNALMRERAKADGMKEDKADMKDFAGLTGLFNTDDVADAETQAEALVNGYEAANQTDELWKLVNAATKASLSKMYECGLLGKDKYDEIKGMYDFYIPLRGWSETTADEVYGYITRNDSNLRDSVLKTAQGRRSVADDPIATIAMIGQQAIAQANRNRMKQKFLTYVLKNPSDLVSVSQLWLRKNEITDEWEPVFADIKDTDDAATVQRKIVDFEEEMKRLSAAEPDKYKTGRQAKGLPYKIGSADMREHTVLVKRGDYTYALTINGNPRAAQALNGLTNPDVGTGWASALFGLGEKMNHFIAPIYTTRNPDFMVGNLFRDAFYGNTMVWVKESPRYATRLNANFVKVNPARMAKLISRYENGKLDMSKPIEQQFHEFMMNGGETGYTNQADIEKQKKEVKRMLKRAGKKISFGKVMDILTSKWDVLNSAVENSMRFATYLTSRQEGRSTLRSIYDSKEASVNFNKKGAGATFMGATGQTTVGKAAAFVSGTGRGLFVFWNAAIQGSFGNFFKYGAKNPKKMAGAVASVFLLGVMQAILGAMDDDEDSKDNYFNQPDYTRRSNILLRVGDQYLAHPLPIEYVQVFGMGEMAATLMMGKEEMTAGEIAVNVAKMMSEYTPLPIDRAGLDHGIMPSSVKPIYEASINESWTGMPIYKQTPFNTNMPEWTKAYKSTSHQLVNLSEAMNRRSGGDEYTKGTIDFNPAQVEYILRGYLSGYYGTVEKMVKSYETIVGDREFEWRNVPLFNRVVKQGDERTANRRMTNDFFEYMNEYEDTKRRINSYSHTKDNLFKYAEKLSEMTRTPEFHHYWLIRKYESRLNAIDKRLKRTTSDEEAETLERKRDALRKEIVDKLKGRIPEEKRDTSGLGRQYNRYRKYIQQ